ncbi:MAG: 4Fe-4S binding protein [Endomicrobium sp.]|jgi:NAD-dependent dihydropyrimidine dehydrogenase PreA subunit|nr:4Fe-4S binding protein [Endomicrobium sp.]
MAYQIDENVCIGCGSCVGICPVFAIESKDNKYAINSDVCVSCGACEPTCPVNAISQK